MNGPLIAIVAYAIILIAVGGLVGRKVSSSSGFFVAGRGLSPLMLFTTLIAANIGAGSTVGTAGLAYRHGLSAWWWVGAAGIGSLILAFLVGPRIWRLAKQYNLLTMGDYLELRYCRVFRGLIAGLMIVGALSLLAVQFVGIAWILEVVAGLDKIWGVLIGAGVTTVYFAAGGLMAAAVVNLVEVAVIIAGFIAALPFALKYVGGWDGLTAAVAVNLAEQPQAFADYFAWNGLGAPTIIGYLFMLTASFFISPGLIGKVFGARDERTIRLGVTANGLVQLVFACVPVLIGMCAFAAFPDLAKSELALPTAMLNMMPMGVATLALAAIFAAEVSTADTVLFMLSTSASKDIYKTFINPKADDRTLLRFSRGAAVVSGVLGVILAIALPSMITGLSIFYGLMSVSLAAPLLFGLFSKRATRGGAITAAVGGVATTLALTRFDLGWGLGKGVWLLNPTTCGILVAALLMTINLFAGKKV